MRGLLVRRVENFTNKDFREHLDFRSLSGGFRMRQPGVNFYFGSEVNTEPRRPVAKRPCYGSPSSFAVISRSRRADQLPGCCSVICCVAA